VTTTNPATALPPPATTDFTWKGRILTRNEIGNIFFFGSLGLLLLGIGLNWILTDGAWYVYSAGNQQYLQSHPYDLVSGGVLVVSLVLLGLGFFSRRPSRHRQRALGFILFGFYWGTQAMKLYASENGDFVNAIFAMFAVFFFNYFAYHELVSEKRKEDPRALHWLAGTAFITTGVYFVTHKIEPVATWLILVVAEQTTWLLHAFGQPVVRCGGVPDGSMIYYPSSDLGCFAGGWFPIQIILACTAIQSIMIFVGGIFALKPPKMGDGISGKAHRYERLLGSYTSRRVWALLLTVPLIYVLNLFRNVIIIWMSGQQVPVLFSSHETAFFFSHNVIGKGGSLVALVIIAFIVFQILPELYDSIIGLLDLKERKGPLESWLGEKLGRRGGGRLKEPAAAEAPATPKPPSAPAEPQLE
jgi:archaeosortase A